MTSIHPPDWWNGPLGPLTTGRDLYAVRPHAMVGRMARHDAADVGGLLALRDRVGPEDQRTSLCLRGRAQRGRRRGDP